MNCPACGSVRIQVLTTRHPDAWTVARYRHCPICRHHWFSAETPWPGRFINRPPVRGEIQLDPGPAAAALSDEELLELLRQRISERPALSTPVQTLLHTLRLSD